MADPVQTVTTPLAKAAAEAAASTVVKTLKADVKAKGASKPWVLVACSFAAGVLADHLLHIF